MVEIFSIHKSFPKHENSLNHRELLFGTKGDSKGIWFSR